MHCVTSLGEERANLSVFRTFIRFALVWFCPFPFPLGVLEGPRLVIMALPGFFSYLFLVYMPRITLKLMLFYLVSQSCFKLWESISASEFLFQFSF